LKDFLKKWIHHRFDWFFLFFIKKRDLSPYSMNTQGNENQMRKEKLSELYMTCLCQKLAQERVKEALLRTKRHQQRDNSENVYEYYTQQLAELDQNFEKLPTEAKLRGTAEDQEYQEFISLLGFGDIQIGSQQKDLRCPISKSIMTNPVKNVCGHSYEEANITELIGRQSAIKCPVAGCISQVRKSTLTKDEELLRELKKTKRKRDTEKEGEYTTV
jgi:hypothetical protein